MFVYEVGKVSILHINITSQVSYDYWFTNSTEFPCCMNTCFVIRLCMTLLNSQVAKEHSWLSDRVVGVLQHDDKQGAGCTEDR